MSLLVTWARTACLAATLTAPAAAHIRLMNPSNGAGLRWSAATSVSIVLNVTGSDDVLDRSHLPALRNAIDAWNVVDGSAASLVEDSSDAAMARTDWASDSVHLVWFDETNASGYFQPFTGVVALTPVWFTSVGVISDADVLFNGAEFDFTTSGDLARFDIQDVATHELGHLLGLDHTGCVGGTMYPYVDPVTILHRSLSLDEAYGLRSVYPDGTFASISGSVVREGAGSLLGAYIVARDALGRTAGSALVTNIGTFVLRGLAAGSYTLSAVPLDQPVSEANLTPGHEIEIDFEATNLGSFSVASGQSLSIGAREVGPDVALALGRSTDLFPIRCVAGGSRTASLRGTGLFAGSTLSAGDPAVSITPTSWFGTQVNFGIDVPVGAALGHVDLVVVDAGGNTSLLAGALEITPEDPIVLAVDPASTGMSGGFEIVITGQGFRPGARVVLGDEVFVDGRDADVSIIDDGTITLVTRSAEVGVRDVVVIDPTGVEGRRVDGLNVVALPAIESAFPTSGSTGGGSRITLRGREFVAGVSVTIDGVFQSEVEIVSSSELVITTSGGVAGGPYVLEITAPGGASASSAFTYVDRADPSLAAIVPSIGKTSGGETVVLSGANFNADHQVIFGADPSTGAGGQVAQLVALLDGNTLQVVTPTHASGVQSVIVLDTATGQAAVLAAGFTFQANKGGGGGCTMTAPDERGTGLAAFAPVLAAVVLLILRAGYLARPRIWHTA